jgi:hypothetical protein
MKNIIFPSSSAFFLLESPNAVIRAATVQPSPSHRHLSRSRHFHCHRRFYPLHCLRDSLRGKFRILAAIGRTQLLELQGTSFPHRVEQGRLEHVRSSIDEPGSVEFCLELEAYVRDVVIGLRNQPDGTCGSVRFPAATFKTLSRAVASVAGRELVVPEDVHDAALLFLPLAFRSSQMQISDILHV